MKNLIKIQDLSNHEIEGQKEIMDLYEEAYGYLAKQSWCKEILEGWYDRNIADKIGVFYFKLDPDDEADEYVWIIVGDIPPAYVDIQSAHNGACAIKVYTEIMEDWIEAVKKKKDLTEVYPVDVPASEKYANMLLSRINFIRKNIFPLYPDELIMCL